MSEVKKIEKYIVRFISNHGNFSTSEISNNTEIFAIFREDRGDKYITINKREVLELQSLINEINKYLVDKGE